MINLPTKDEADALVEAYVAAYKSMKASHPARIVVSVSGGKDSTCVYLRAMELLGDDFDAVFADVGNEHEATLEFVARLPEVTGGPPIRTVKADLSDKFPRRRERIREKWPEDGVSEKVIERALAIMHPTGNVFLDLCLLRGGFPSMSRKFCTEHLKQVPIEKQVNDPLRERGIHPVTWQGIRTEESLNRRDRELILTWIRRPPTKKEKAEGKLTPLIKPFTQVYPILWWQINDVWAMHKKHGVMPNPLYRQGFKRVGCMPCINARKSDVRQMAERFPEQIGRIEEWESIVAQASKREVPCATFFFAGSRPGVPRDSNLITTDKHGIRSAVDWSMSDGRGKHANQYNFNFGQTDCDDVGFCE